MTNNWCNKNRTLSGKQLKSEMSHVVRKPAFCICEIKDADQLRFFAFTTRIVQSLYFLNSKFQASSHLLWLYSPVCVGPGRKPRRPVLSQRGSNRIDYEENVQSEQLFPKRYTQKSEDSTEIAINNKQHREPQQ